MSQPQLVWMFVLALVAAGVTSLGGLLWVAARDAGRREGPGRGTPPPELEPHPVAATSR